jgi:hypothetical protein
MSCERKLDPHTQAAPKCLTKYDTDHFVHVLQEAHSLDNVHVRRRMIAAHVDPDQESLHQSTGVLSCMVGISWPALG